MWHHLVPSVSAPFSFLLVPALVDLSIGRRSVAFMDAAAHVILCKQKEVGREMMMGAARGRPD
jgi:hypothetical protein